MEIENLASLCPWENGPAVYKARALYDLVFDTLRIFENSCVEDTTIGDTILARKSNTTMAGVKQIAGSDGQQYKLFPNPNNGSFTLQQAIADDKPVIAELWDVAGRSIYKNRLSFADMKAGLHIMNAIPGTYLLQLIDSSGRTFRFKVTVE